MELWLDHQKTVIWLKNGKYQLVIEREIIEASGGFYVARLSLEQYGRIDNPNCIGDILNTERYKANKAIFLPSLTYWLRIHVANWKCVYLIVLYSIHLLVIITFIH